MAIQWLRLWHEMPNDPKWRTIARSSKQSISSVIAVYLHLLVAASANATERGRTESVCIEDVASALDLETEQIEQIMAAMQGRVLEGDLISGWEKRQVEREDGSAARAKAWREAKKLEKETQANATERKQTPDKDKDKDKEEKRVGSTRGSRITEGWVPSAEDAAFCKTERPDLRPSEVAKRFYDYWISVPGAKGRKTDWPATWRNWVRAERQGKDPVVSTEKQKWD